MAWSDIVQSTPGNVRNINGNCIVLFRNADAAGVLYVRDTNGAICPFSEAIPGVAGAANGLRIDGTTGRVYLGGTLLENTTIAGDTFDFGISQEVDTDLANVNSVDFSFSYNYDGGPAGAQWLRRNFTNNGTDVVSAVTIGDVSGAQNGAAVRITDINTGAAAGVAQFDFGLNAGNRFGATFGGDIPYEQYNTSFAFLRNVPSAPVLSHGQSFCYDPTGGTNTNPSFVRANVQKTSFVITAPAIVAGAGDVTFQSDGGIVAGIVGDPSTPGSPVVDNLPFTVEGSNLIFAVRFSGFLKKMTGLLGSLSMGYTVYVATGSAGYNSATISFAGNFFLVVPNDPAILGGNTYNFETNIMEVTIPKTVAGNPVLNFVIVPFANFDAAPALAEVQFGNLEVTMIS